MENIGYQSHNTILNLSTLYFVLMFYLVKLILLAALHSMRCRSNKVYKRLNQSLVWSEFLKISIEGFMELYITGYLEYSYPLDTSAGEVKARIVGWVCLVQSLVVFPSILIWVALQDVTTFQE